MSTTERWSEANSRQFIDVGPYVAPDREQQIELIGDLIPPREGAAHVLDLCCGEGLLAEAILSRSETWTVHGLDGSQVMLDQAQLRLGRFGPRFRTQLFDLAAADWRQRSQPVHAAVSSLAIHHLDGAQKQALFRDIHEMLLPGGVLLIADVVQPATPQAVEAAIRIWDDAVRQRSLSLSSDLRGWEAFQRDRWNLYRYPNAMDKPDRLSDQLMWLSAAGFAAVDVFWLKAGHAIYGGQKA